MLTTPENIRTLQRKLYHKAKQEPRFRFYALYDKVCRADILEHAYKLVRSNKGAPGVDGISFKTIEAEEGWERFLLKLAEELRNRTYRTDAVRRVWIPKADGSKRPLGIPTIRDRVVQMAVKLVIEPIFEADFCETSYGFRPNRSAHDAADAVAEALLCGHSHVIDADLSKYFDTIPHAKLLATVAERVSDGAVLALIKEWLKAPVSEEDEKGSTRMSGGKGNRLGTPQGGVISPLLANLYLHLLDRFWRKYDLAKQYRARIVRYADDLVILCVRDTEPSMKVLRAMLERLDLRLNETKTRIVDATQDGFNFLGFTFAVRRSWKSGKLYPHVEPSTKAVKRVKDICTEMTSRQQTLLPLPDLVRELNQRLRGWAGYFHYRNCSRVFKQIRWHVEERLRTHLRKRHKIRNRMIGYSRFPTRQLYERYGLYKLPATAGWSKAHAS